VQSALNGRQCIELFESSISSGTDVLAILMDLQMPILDGMSAADYILQQWPSANIVAITGTDTPFKSRKSKCLQMGFSEYLSKPVLPSQLRDTLRRTIANRVRVRSPLLLGNDSMHLKPIT